MQICYPFNVLGRLYWFHHWGISLPEPIRRYITLALANRNISGFRKVVEVRKDKPLDLDSMICFFVTSNDKGAWALL